MSLRERNADGILGIQLIGTSDIPEDSLLYALSLLNVGSLLSIEITNIDDYPGKFVNEDGTHNFTTIPGNLQGYVYVDGVQYPLNYSLQSGLTFWPTELPDGFLIDGYHEIAADPAIHDNIAYGPDIDRRRTYLRLLDVTGDLILTIEQFITLEDFYFNTLVVGSLAFHWANSLTGETSVYRFLEAPIFVSASGNRIRVTLHLLQRDYV